MKEIQTESGKILCVEVPEDVTWWNFTDNNLGNFVTKELSLGNRFLQYGTSSTFFGKEVTNKVYYNPDTFYCCQYYEDAEILGKLSELTDKDCEEFVDKYMKLVCAKEGDNYNEIKFACYAYSSTSNQRTMALKSAKESFLSLLQSEGIDTSKEHLIIKVI